MPTPGPRWCQIQLFLSLSLSLSLCSDIYFSSKVEYKRQNLYFTPFFPLFQKWLAFLGGFTRGIHLVILILINVDTIIVANTHDIPLLVVMIKPTQAGEIEMWIWRKPVKILWSQIFHEPFRCEADVFACPHPVRIGALGECPVSEIEPDKLSHFDLVVGSDA